MLFVDLHWIPKKDGPGTYLHFKICFHTFVGIQKNSKCKASSLAKINLQYSIRKNSYIYCSFNGQQELY